MGGKGGGSEPPFTLTDTAQQSAQLEALLGLFGGLMEGMVAQNAAIMQQMTQIANKPSIPDLPSVFEEPEIDWTEENQKLQGRMDTHREVLLPPSQSGSGPHALPRVFSKTHRYDAQNRRLILRPSNPIGSNLLCGFLFRTNGSRLPR